MKLYLILGIIGMALLSYITYLRNSLEVAELNTSKLQTALVEQGETLAKLRQDYEKIANIRDALDDVSDMQERRLQEILSNLNQAPKETLAKELNELKLKQAKCIEDISNMQYQSISCSYFASAPDAAQSKK